MQRMCSIFLIFVITTSLTACITISEQKPRLTSISKPELHFGLIMIKHGTDQDNTMLIEDSVLGTWLGTEGIGIGYKTITELTPNPKCQIIFIMKDDTQLERTFQLLEKTKHLDGEYICPIKHS